jgi:uncharacterized SAM-binding protein YcdF (DUF218 family)
LTQEQIEQPRAQGIVLLSAGRDRAAREYGGDTLGALSLQRARYAAWLQRRSALPLFIAGGSAREGATPVAELLRQTLENEFQVPVAGLETHSQSTAENARNMAKLLKNFGVEHIFLVSHAWHLPRAVSAFEQTGLRVTPAPTAFAHTADFALRPFDFVPHSGALRANFYAIHEYLGRLWYSIRAFIA